MFRSLWDDVQKQFRHGNMITRLVLINVGVFVLINLTWLILKASAGGSDGIYRTVLHFLCLSSSPWEIITRPWTPFTSMFLHESFWHILWNMLFLYWFGRIVGDLIGDHKILPMYLMGGLVGGLAFVLSALIIGYGGGSTVYALGASGAVMGLVMAAGVLAPDYEMRLILIGNVKLKYIVAVILFFDIIGLGSNVNTGGHFAHLGGALFGYLYIYYIRRGRDLARPYYNVIDWLTEPADKKKPEFKVFSGNKHTSSSKEKKRKDKVSQERIDAILDKIREDGYDSLTEEEKEYLFQASKK